MFTGIVQALGTVTRLERREAGARLSVAIPATLLKRLRRGDSIAVNGCCLTVTAKNAGALSADLSPETLARTTLGALVRGTRVNIELPLRVGDMLSGHLLQGHVEATGAVRELAPAGAEGNWTLRIAVPTEVARYLAPKGSIAVDGISLTVAELRRGEVAIAIIPYTHRHTNLRYLEPGAAVNLETDPMARHLERLLEARQGRRTLSRAARPPSARRSDSH